MTTSTNHSQLNPGLRGIALIFMALLGLSLCTENAFARRSNGGTTTTTTTTSMGGGGGGGGAATTAIPVLDATGVTLVVQQVNKTMHDGANVPFWVFCANGMGGGGGGCQVPSPVLQLGVGQTANIVLNMMMAPQEQAPYQGHTIHNHGMDVSQIEDGVPETGAGVLGDTYSYKVDSRYVGSHMYHCHVHTVKHLEMGMYGALVVKDTDSAGNLLNVVNHGGPTYDYEWNLLLGAVDPAYHAQNAVGDSAVFADYNPKYFLINGNEGLSKTAPADTLAAAAGRKVVIRLVGTMSVNATFSIKNANGANQSFTIYNNDGFKLPTPKTATSVVITPGSNADIMVTLPATSSTWYPQITYTSLRNGAAYSGGTVYGALTF